MNIKRLLFQIATGLLVAVILVFVAFAVMRNLSSERTEPPPTGTDVTTATATTPVVKNDRAFVKIDRADPTVSPGGTWTVGISSNSWSSCLADLYTPDENVSEFKDPKDAQAAKTGDGKFSWAWKVPGDATKGKWTVRILCGTYENLSTRDVTVEVR